MRTEMNCHDTGFDRLLSTVDETGSYLNVGRTKIYELFKQGALRSVKIGAKRLVPNAEIRRYVEALVAEAGR